MIDELKTNDELKMVDRKNGREIQHLEAMTTALAGGKVLYAVWDSVRSNETIKATLEGQLFSHGLSVVTSRGQVDVRFPGGGSIYFIDTTFDTQLLRGLTFDKVIKF